MQTFSLGKKFEVLGKIVECSTMRSYRGFILGVVALQSYESLCN